MELSCPYFPEIPFLLESHMRCIDAHKCVSILFTYSFFKHYYLDRDNLLSSFCVISIWIVSEFSLFQQKEQYYFWIHLQTHAYKSFSESKVDTKFHKWKNL